MSEGITAASIPSHPIWNGETSAHVTQTVASQLAYNPGKLGTILALSTLAPEEFITTADLRERINSMQGMRPSQMLSPYEDIIGEYCRRSLGPAEILDFDAARQMRAKRLRLNGNGRLYGVPAAAALLDIELQGKHSLSQALTHPSKAGTFRIHVYSQLVDQPHGASGSALARSGNVDPSTLQRTMSKLVGNGILGYTDADNPARYRFMISNPDERPSSRLKCLPIGRTATHAVAQLYREGQRHLTAEELIKTITAEHTIPSDKVWAYLRNSWLPNNSGLLTQISPETNGSKSPKLVCITPEWQPFLSQLVRACRLLVAPTKEGDEYRQWAYKRANEMVRSENLMAEVFRRGPAPATDEPVEAEKTVGEDRREDKYVDVIDEDDETTRPRITVQRPPKKSVKVAVALPERPITFPLNWRNWAHCVGDDPDLYFPPGTAGPSIVQAEQAKAVCQKCPVALACLSAALRTKVTNGVRGGVWMERIDEELPLSVRKQVLSMVWIND